MIFFELLFAVFTFVVLCGETCVLMSGDTKIARLKRIKHGHATKVNEIFGSTNTLYRFVPTPVQFPCSLKDDILGYAVTSTSKSAVVYVRKNTKKTPWSIRRWIFSWPVFSFIPLIQLGALVQQPRLWKLDSQFDIVDLFEQPVHPQFQDYSKSAAEYLRLAREGDIEGQINTGMSYLNGLGLAADSKEAAMWFRKAADQGSARGQLNLGVIYLNGFGVEKSEAQAAYWLELATLQGDKDASKELDHLHEK